MERYLSPFIQFKASNCSFMGVNNYFAERDRKKISYFFFFKAAYVF